MRPYPRGADLLLPLGRVRMPRAPRLYAPGATVHVVARCNNREFAVAADADFEVLVTHLREMSRTYDVPVYAYALMSNHVHLLLQAPTGLDALGRPLRWFMTETATAFHRTRGRRGHFWERRYHACVVEGDAYALAALRYLDRNPLCAPEIGDVAVCVGLWYRDETMPRQARLDAPGTLHHVMVRGIERTTIFRDDDRPGGLRRPGRAGWRSRGPSPSTPGRSSRITPTSCSARVPGRSPGACARSSRGTPGASIGAISGWAISSRTGTSPSWWRRSPIFWSWSATSI